MKRLSNRVSIFFLFCLLILHVFIFLNAFYDKVSIFSSLPLTFYIFYSLVLVWYLVVFVQIVPAVRCKIVWIKPVRLLFLVLSTMLVIGVLKMSKYTYLIDIQLRYPQHMISERLSSFFLDCIFFSTFFLLAFFYRNNEKAYIKYLIVTSFFLFAISVDRFIYTNIIGWIQEFQFVNFFMLFFISLFWVYDCYSDKKLKYESPFLISVILLLFYNYLSSHFSQSLLWRNIAHIMIDRLFNHIYLY